MPQGVPTSDFEFFRGALPEAAFWGRLALAVGAAGLLASLLLVVAHLRDRISLSRGRSKPEQYRPPAFGPLRGSLGDFFADPLHVAPLSPDAASEYVAGRLDTGRDLTQSLIRYFSYAPLLLGLMGTTFALRTLLVTGGSTLKEIQPHLSGVFAGTLAGIGGSLLAAIGGLLLERVSLSSANRAQDFIHRFILPSLPERRISIRIEDAVLAEIAERAQAVAETFRSAIAPVAAEMQEVALQCAKAAEESTNAFSEAVRALREVGDLEVASRNFKAGAHMIDSSAEQLSEATKQTSEIILRAGEVRGALAGVLDVLQAASQSLGTASERVGTALTAQLSDLNAAIITLESTVSGLRSTGDVLSAELTRRAISDSVQVEEVKAYAASADRVLAGLAETASQSFDTVRRVESRVGEISERAVEALTREISPRAEESTNRTEQMVGELALNIGKYGSETTKALAEIRQRIDGVAGFDSREITNDLREIADGVKRGFATAPSPSPPKKGLFRWPWK